jgi:hypothetical protein
MNEGVDVFISLRPRHDIKTGEAKEDVNGTTFLQELVISKTISENLVSFNLSSTNTSKLILGSYNVAPF